MTIGMEIYDANGALQVSTEFLSYFCRKSGTGTTVARVGGNTTPSSVLISVTGYTNPIVAFVSGTYQVALTGKDANGNLVFATRAPIGTAITYYVFDQSNLLPASHVGMELYNAAGQIVFNTASHPMLGLGTLQSYTIGQAAVTFTGKTVAVAPMAYGGHRKAGMLYCASGALRIWSPGTACSNVQYQNDGKVYGGAASADTVTAGEVSWDDVKISCGNDTNYSVPPNYDAKVTMLVLDVGGIPLNTTFF
jgi:hypothetical protein